MFDILAGGNYTVDSEKKNMFVLFHFFCTNNIELKLSFNC